MTITHQTLMDANGNPTAALIPWPEFQAIQKRLASEQEPVESDADVDAISSEWSEEVHRRAAEIDNGSVELIDGDDFLARLRAV